MEVRVERVCAEATWPLRQAVLRPSQRIEEVVVPGEDSPGAVHIAATTPDGAVVATAVLMPEVFPLVPGRSDGWRLRGMATDPELRGHGIGGQVLQYVIAYVGDRGGGLLWCHARVPAQRFYERAGLVPIGAPWTDPEIGPHVAMWREVSAAPEPDKDRCGAAGTVPGCSTGPRRGQ